MMTEPTRIGEDNAGRCSSHAQDCPDALPLKIDQQELDGAKQTREQWQQENRQAMERYNERVVAHGVFSDGFRSF